MWFVCLKHFQTSRAPEAAGAAEVPAAGTRSPGVLRCPTRGRPRAGARTWPLMAPSKKPKRQRRVASVAAASPALLRASGSKDRAEPRHGMRPHSRAGVAPRAAPSVTPRAAPSVAPGTAPGVAPRAAPSTAAPWPDRCLGPGSELLQAAGCWGVLATRLHPWAGCWGHPGGGPCPETQGWVPRGALLPGRV